MNYIESVLVKSRILKCKPSLNLKQTDSKYVQKFQNSWYLKYEWLVGNSTKSTLHCYYCLMFQGDDPWGKSGINIMENFENKVAKHAASKVHIQKHEMFKILGRTRIDHSLSESVRIQAVQYAEKVTRNRRILSRLINVVCYLAHQKLAIRGQREGEMSNYLDLLHLLAAEEPFIRHHLGTSTIFRGTSPDIQNDLIQVLTLSYYEKVKRELDSVESVSVQADEITDVSVKAQLSTIIRYVYGPRILEQFLGFKDVSNDKTGRGIASIIIPVLEKFKIGEELICQTYDGASVNTSIKKGVHACICEKFPNAVLFVH